MPANCCLEDIHWRTCLPTTAKHHSTYSEANTFVTSEWKGERGKGLCNAQRKVTPSPPHWGPPFAWPICSFNSLVRPCECDYTVYWSTCFTYFVILESSTRLSLLLYSPFLSLSLSFSPTSAFYKMFQIFAVSPITDSKSVRGIWTSKCCS